MSHADITIVIATFKSSKIIGTCLESIDKRCKVIIIENSGERDLKNLVKKKHNNIEFIVANENLGYGKANNLGLSKVKTKYALILNPDTFLEKNALENFLNRAKKFPDFTLLGPLLGQRLDAKETKEKKLIVVKNLKGFAIFFNLSKFKEKSFYDKNYFLYFEDIDLCRKVRNENGKIYLDPEVKIFHSEAQSVDPSLNFEVEKNRNWHWMWSTFYYHKKYSNFLTALFIVSPKLLSSLTKTLFYYLIFNKKKRIIYQYRLMGLINSILGKKSWYRLSLD